MGVETEECAFVRPYNAVKARWRRLDHAMPASLDDFLQERVVLDTQGPLMYIGLLTQIDPGGYWLADVDLHDRSEGHSTKEVYLVTARELEMAGSVRVNRRLAYVDRSAVVSVSLLRDVVTEDDVTEDEAPWPS